MVNQKGLFMMGFYTEYGYCGYIGDGKFIEFATIEEYEQYIIEQITECKPDDT